MSGLGSGAVLVLVILAAQVTPGSAEPAAGLQVRLLSDVVQPDVIQPGQITIRRVTLDVADGVTLSFPDVLPAGEGTEPSRMVRVHRHSHGGGVRWVLSYPFTAWTEGYHRTEPFTVHGNGPAGSIQVEVGAVGLRVASRLPAARLMRPAPAEDPRPASMALWLYLPVIPAMLSVVTGAAWWRRSRVARSEAEEPPPASEPPGPSLREVLGHEHQGASAAAIALARSARCHPGLEAIGVRRWHTTPEILGLAERAGRPPADLLLPVLEVGDAAAFGGFRPDLSDVLEAGSGLLGALEDD